MSPRDLLVPECAPDGGTGVGGESLAVTAEFTDALEFVPGVVAQQAGCLGRRPARCRISAECGGIRCVRGCSTAALRVPVERFGFGADVEVGQE